MCVLILCGLLTGMSTENLNRTSVNNNIETPVINEGVLNPESKVVNKSEVISKINLVNESSFVIKKKIINTTKRTCINALNQRLYNIQKKDKINLIDINKI